MKVLIICLSAIALLLLTCNTTKKKPVVDEPDIVEEDASWNPQLHDIWVLTELNGKEITADKRPRLELFPKDSRMGGYGGCNNLFGNMEAKSKTINFSQIGSTKMYCADEMDVESEFITTLSEVDKYAIKSLQLYLFKGDDIALIFQKVD